MQEDFLHYLWRHKKFEVSKIRTENNEQISIISVGDYNQDSGPDFFNAQLRIGNQLWAGSVEIHVKSSDWYLHNHETDSNYDNVILHVVWEHDTDVYRKDNTSISTLELRHYIPKETLHNYEKLFSKSEKWINCEQDLAGIDDFKVNNWLERLYFERLERKSYRVKKLLGDSKNDWEAVLFKTLAKNFGLKVNGDAFLSIADSIDFSIVRKAQSNQTILEALFFGQADLLESDIQDQYYLNLVKEYKYLKQKFSLPNKALIPIQFFRLRPANFPTIRLSQLASLYHYHKNLFSKIIELQHKDEFYNLFAIETSSYWETHFAFGKPSKPSKKRITKAFVDLLLINTIIPIKFSYALHIGKQIDSDIINLLQGIVSEKNSIVEKFNSIKPVSKSALQSQALIQLKNDYCDKNRCLHCNIGNEILTRND
ncbi:DUF2851 family protein [Yeosuana marina]|uniref:DUF2851 family protein n=1 Tax=Yeosuana marina TaxID=1565536 RepID=UPI00141F9E16|nr:DUF2851 family protein [Yeosuana marina]